MEKVLITGGAGFIGSNIARKLIGMGYQVTILDNFNPQIHGAKKELPADLADAVKLIHGDVSDKALFYDCLQKNDSVIHLAAETGTGQSMYNIAHYTNINILATAYLCDYIVNEPHQLKTVIVASSRSIYGEGKYKSPEHGIVYPGARTAASISNNFEVADPVSGRHDLEILATDESSRIHPSSFYGITKQVQEQMVILATRLKGIKGFALRYQNVFGPGQSLKNPYTGILSIFSRLALRNEKINIFEDGLESRDFVYIADVVNATVKCLDDSINGHHILNVGSGVATSVHEVAAEIVHYLKSKSEIFISGAFREGDIRHNYADLTMLKEVLGFEPSWSFNKGLYQFLDWVQAQEDIPDNVDDYKRSLGELEERGLLKNKI
ncbi:dTDP-L-rhamnose 4-epimerase [Chitinophaga niastensis]|uniref:dTDP-L-rhamnose 4-epimerase n=1 Tax=Chitinophaga niastensis TaxID=536980 RepID=A0A2P8HRS2_CHINA|nr:SDR family NAD(P)-dependent oxidoreductase [Chitinophaga niastensis]PSL48939.1 dTDP-L-rhamnose 4-epimerase [Chitinophaga niastensis]